MDIKQLYKILNKMYKKFYDWVSVNHPNVMVEFEKQDEEFIKFNKILKELVEEYGGVTQG